MSLPVSGEWHDLSLPISPDTATWPGDPAVEIDSISCLSHGDDCTVSRLTLGTHTGTHVDGLNHFLRNAASVDEMPLDLMVGEARLIEIEDQKQITKAELLGAQIEAGERLLFRTRNSREAPTGAFREDFVHFSEEAAVYLADRKVALVGVDYLSVGGYEGNVVEVHKALLGAGIWCVEGLRLGELSAGRYELVCLPIRLVDGDGGLARAIARRLPDPA